MLKDEDIPKNPDNDEEPHDLGFSTSDLTDERDPLDWKSKYPKEAKKLYWGEVAYLIAYLILMPLLVVLVHYSSEITTIRKDVIDTLEPFIVGWMGGAFGGALFAAKWTYHCIAKQMWHLDRRPWRLMLPIISGSFALIFVILIYSSFLGLFDSNIVHKCSSVFVLGILVGYFSDNAVAKLVEVADTLFGPRKTF